jgi:uncharacterized ferritin-like protein (DUF455 family)
VSDDFFNRVQRCLLDPDVDSKGHRVGQLKAEWDAGRFPGLESPGVVEPIGEPGRPAKPILVAPAQLEPRKVSSVHGRATLIHSLAHIEFNAINLALDAAYRFRGLPRDYYADWLKVAAEEAYHFSLLRGHLRDLGYDYGDFPAHNGLWEMAMRTAHDPLVRMALVPRILEARGLDVTPAIMHKLASSGDKRAVEILEIIQRDEIGHVAIGNRWYASFCEGRGLEPVATFRRLLQEYDAPALKPPFDWEARRAAGFSESELELLQALSSAQPRGPTPRHE